MSSDWKWADVSEKEKWKVYWGVLWRGVVVMTGFWLILITIVALVASNPWIG